MKFTRILFILILTISCSNKEFSLDEYANYPVEFAKQKITPLDGEFEIFIPKNWKWKTKKIEDEYVIYGIEVSSKPNKEGFIDIISILKTKSFGNGSNLKSEYEYYLNTIENSSIENKIINHGFTKISNHKSFFLHVKSNSEEYGEIETISFILESENEGEFYSLTASLSRTNELNKNMSVLIQSLKTFNYSN